ncbi:unnamed protein product [Penicillium roqueforti FM164]|uniref:Genomic scaffold, ProqFM164S04 n=1 Tax=Penicillium roqueforti (strain FM164) TaxID=1365484 RepID=W6QEX6_PENRF|nr:unnamed protein product [Penicillium roqueforti FM164]
MSLELYHTAYNAGQTTAVLTHGALVSGLYWDLVIPTSRLTSSWSQIFRAMASPPVRHSQWISQRDRLSS